jgi:hypothetical protein
VAAHQHAQLLESEPGHFETGLDGKLIHSSVPNAVWVGAGMEERFASQVLKVLPVGKAAWARRVAKAERSRPATSSLSSTLSTSAGSQRWALAVASTSGAMRRIYGKCM